MKQKVLSFLLAAVLTLTLAPAARAADSFSDVPPSHWAYSDIMACAEAGTVTGYTDGTFRPDDEVSTVQFLAMMVRTFYKDELSRYSLSGYTLWYVPYVMLAGHVGMSKNLSSIADTPMNRYDMAMVLYNTTLSFNKFITSAQGDTARSQIKDWNTITASYTTYKNAVTNCYALGILTGMSDGAFHGEQSMTRAQACAVIVRMMKLINSSTPTTPVKPTTPTTPTTPSQPQQPQTPAQTTTGKLANGKDATVENVLAILEEIKKEYPEGTVWHEDVKDPNNHWYRAGGGMNSDIQDLTNQVHSVLNLQRACGGWMAMVSDRIFGRNGAPAREVTDLAQVRPGDCVFYFNENGKCRHVAIVAYTDGRREYTDFYGVKTTPWIIDTCDGNYNDQVKWPLYEEYSNGPYMFDEELGVKYRIFTRYPN